MAAPRRCSGLDTDTDTDSDSSGEAAARFREAAWDCATLMAVRAEPCGGGLKKDQLQPAQPSLRHEVKGHDEDGNELQTTPEFRAHVAKKLGAMLDSFITVLKDSSGTSQTSVQQSDSADDGFRLFSSSVPGDCGKSEPCPAARRQPSSSSDMDSDQEWQKYQEAAVSAADILKQSAFPALSQDSSWDQSQGYVEHRHKKKKKKKIKGENNIKEKIIDPLECDQISKDLPQLVSANGQHERQDSNCTENSVLPGVVKKKKKKKKRE
ncbi:protein CUSTOS [Grus japonensis]|uniref:Protein CUSTOS n=1 Tax=Grus japonensis TaxID=30415 RepID=A0ABC9XGP0_GRUJA